MKMYSLHHPSVTVNCVDCYRIDHCNFCTKFIVRLIPQVNRRFTDFCRFPRSISVKSIVVVMSQMRDATRKFAIATTMKKSFSTNFGSKLYPLLSWGDARLTTLVWSHAMPYRHRVGTHKVRTYPPIVTVYFEVLLLWQYGCGLRSPNLSISQVTSSVRSISNMDFLNHVSRINRSWMFLFPRFLHFFWSWFAVWYSLSLFFFTYLWPCGGPFLM